jgi:putative ABC transport system permease protein
VAIPLSYNVRSVRVRWTSTVVALLGIAGTVGVFIAMLAMARGFRATLVASGSPDNAILRRAGSTSEMESSATLEQVQILGTLPGVARDAGGPLLTAEVVVVAAFPLKATGTDANVQVRGVSPRALSVRNTVKLVAGRFFEAGRAELVVGHNVAGTYAGFDIGSSIKFGGQNWTVVGVFDAGGSAFDSEIWSDATILSETYQRPVNVFQSVTVHLTSPDALAAFKDAVTADPRLTFQVEREIEYYEKQSRFFTKLITVLGSLVAGIMALGAIFGALNTMYSAVSERGREIATLRALGFGSGSITLSFLFEALFIAFVGGVLGCLAALPVNGLTTGTMNWQTFSHLAFAFKITPGLLLWGIVFALAMGLIGGLPPAIHAARRPVASALREL